MSKKNNDSQYLGDLLAIIHGDGGHYQAEHGTEKAVNDAIDKFYKMKMYIDYCHYEWEFGRVPASLMAWEQSEIKT